MAGDITIEGHELSALYGSDSLGWYAYCECEVRFEGAHPAELVDTYEQHYAALCLSPGVGKARAALAEAIERKAAS